MTPAGFTDDELVNALIGVIGSSGAATVRLELPADCGRERAGELLRAALPEEPPAGVLSLLALASGTSVTGLTAGVAATVTLVQALGDVEFEVPLWCVTQGAVRVDSADAEPDPDQAQVWGLGRVVGLEHPRRWGGLVDLPETLNDSVVSLVHGVLAGGDDEDQVALRTSGRYGRRLVRATAGGTTVRWKPRGTVVVTGGTGALGGHLARWLAANGAEHLVLTSRRGRAAPGADALVRELTALGTRATVVACDVADRAALADVLAAIPEEHPLTAVVHAAGVGDPTALVDTDLAEFARVVSAKAAGAANLDALLEETPLDAFVLFSSIAATWGSGGQAAYSAGNAYLDALAERRRARGLVATSIAWGPWAGEGMAEGEAGEQMLRRGVPGLPPEHAITALRHALDRAEPAVVVADVDWSRFIPAFTAMRSSPLLGDLPEVREVLAETAESAAAAAGDSVLLDRLHALPAADREQELVNLVRDAVATVLGYSSAELVDPTRPFRDLGFDSLAAVELRDGLTAATGLRLPSTLVFDYPTTAAVAEHLGNEIAPATVPPATEELDRLEASLMSLPPDDGERTRVMARLEILVAKWKEATGAPASSSIAGQLDSASDDEMFELLGNEFGIS